MTNYSPHRTQHQFSVTQADGGGYSDSDSISSDDETESSTDDDTESSSEPEANHVKLRPEKKTRALGKTLLLRSVGRPSKNGIKKEKSTYIAQNGGRTLRSRKKLQDAKLVAQKKLGFSCSQCRKDYTSQASLNRHAKFCKKKSRRKSQVVTEPVEKKKRGRKPKVRTDSVEPQPSSSAYTEDVDYTEFQEVTDLEVPSYPEPIVGDDGKVLCTRCNNTYRTTTSYQNHLGNCFCFSDDDEDDDEDQHHLHQSEEPEPVAQTAFEIQGRTNCEGIEDESESESETTSCSDVDSMPTPLVTENPAASSYPPEEEDVVETEMLNEDQMDEEDLEVTAESTTDDMILEAASEMNPPSTSQFEPEYTGNEPTGANVEGELEEDEICIEEQDEIFVADQSLPLANNGTELLPQFSISVQELPERSSPASNPIQFPYSVPQHPQSQGLFRPSWTPPIPSEPPTGGGSYQVPIPTPPFPNAYPNIMPHNEGHHNFQAITMTTPPPSGQHQQMVPAMFPYQNSQPPPPFQTVTLQDASTGQLVTIQMPIVSQQESPHPQPLYHQLPPFQNESQLDQYRRQVQAAVHLQQQQAVYQQQMHQQRQQPARTQMMTQEEFHHRRLDSTPSLTSLMQADHPLPTPAPVPPPVGSTHRAADGLTYMVLQYGNPQSFSPASATQESYRVSEQPSTSAHTSSILVSTLESAPRIPAEPSSSSCLKHQAPQRMASCACVDCQRIVVPTMPSMMDMHPPLWTLPKPVQIQKKQKSGKIRARLASIVSERQGQGLQLFRSLTSPNTILPKLLPATISPPTPTSQKIVSTSSFSLKLAPADSEFKPPAIPATTITSDSLTAPIVSASAAPALKPPTPSPNIAVVRPMEHPLQRISNQIQLLGDSFSSPIDLNLSTVPSLTVVPMSMPQPVSTVPSSVIPAIPLTAVTEPIVPTPVPISVPEPEEIKKTPATPPPSVPKPQPITATMRDKRIKISLKRPAGRDYYSINKISGSTTSPRNQFTGIFKTLKIKGKITTGDQAGTSTDVVVVPVVHTIPIPDASGDDEGNFTIAEDEESRSSSETSIARLDLDEKRQPIKTMRLTHSAVVVYEVKIDDKVQYRSSDVRAVWGYILERVQGTRRNHHLPPLAYPATNISLPENKREAAASFNKLGLTHRAVQFLLEQLPGVKNAAKEGSVYRFHQPPKFSASVEDLPMVVNPTGSVRSEGYTGRKPFDMFGWLASKHRQPDPPTVFSRRGDMKGGNLPMAMKYRNMIKFGTKHLNVFWSSIHGRGLFTTRDIEPGDIIIEYAGEVIRPLLSDLREKYYESKGIGCYMFKMDDNSVVDATLKGNAARFINHSCDPNCRSRTVDILGNKHILILSLRKIIAGEELTYDYKFEQEGDKLPCSCGTKKCRKFLN